MAVKYQFNKISLLVMRKQLKIRVNALPTIKSKESALRVRVKKQKQELERLKSNFDKKYDSMKNFIRLWAEFPEAVFFLKEALFTVKKIAGIKTPFLEKLDFTIKDFSRFGNPPWLTMGVEILKEITNLITEIKIAEKNTEILEYARKKTTQKVNLYEKVQIPEYSEAILRIKRYLEDVENLEKSAQKITKQRHSEQEQKESV